MSNANMRARRAQVEILTATLGKVLESAGVPNGEQLAIDISRTAYREARDIEEGALIREPYERVANLVEIALRAVRK